MKSSDECVYMMFESVMRDTKNKRGLPFGRKIVLVPGKKVRSKLALWSRLMPWMIFWLTATTVKKSIASRSVAERPYQPLHKIAARIRPAMIKIMMQ